MIACDPLQDELKTQAQKLTEKRNEQSKLQEGLDGLIDKLSMLTLSFDREQRR